MEKQNELLRLIMKKMEIVAEADTLDDGGAPECTATCKKSGDMDTKEPAGLQSNRIQAKMMLLKLRKHKP